MKYFISNSYFSITYVKLHLTFYTIYNIYTFFKIWIPKLFYCYSLFHDTIRYAMSASDISMKKNCLREF